MERWSWKHLNEKNWEYKLKEIAYSAVRFADNTATGQHLESQLNDVIDEYGMTSNTKKTLVMVLTKKGNKQVYGDDRTRQ